MYCERVRLLRNLMNFVAVTGAVHPGLADQYTDHTMPPYQHQSLIILETRIYMLRLCSVARVGYVALSEHTNRGRFRTVWHNFIEISHVGKTIPCL